MNCGLSNLAYLKGIIFPAGMANMSQWNNVIQQVGLGVAAQFDKLTNRNLGYMAGDSWVISADRMGAVLPRFPVVSITSLVLTGQVTQVTTDKTNQIANSMAMNGVVEFTDLLGTYRDLLTFTWTGGFWFETAEPTDNGYPSTVPTGATVLPQDLQYAFALQCQAVLERQRLLKAGAFSPDDVLEGLGIAKVEILPGVNQTLRQYKRFA